jgi:hypothetical protein
MPRPLLPSELERPTLPDDGTSISARVREDLEAGHEPVDLAQAARLAQRVVTRWRGLEYEFSDEAHYLARAVLAQGALLDKYEETIMEYRART